MKAGFNRQDRHVAAEQLVADLQIRLKHIQNDYCLTRREYESATIRYLDMLAEVNRQNRELETLKNQLEKRVRERTAMLEISNRALADSESRLQMVLNATSDGIWDHNLLTDAVYFSPGWGQMLGFEPDEIEPHYCAWRKLIHPEDQAIVSAALQAHLDGRSLHYSTEMRLRNKRGQWQWVISRGKVVERDAQGRPMRMVGTNIDITARKRAEEQMAQASKMIALGTLVAGVAHEINNPNNFIMLGGPILQKYFNGMQVLFDERQRDEGDFVVAGVNYSQLRQDVPRLLEGILEGSRRIRNIVRDLRDFARPDTSDLDQLVDLNNVLRSVVSLMNGVIRKATNRFKMEPAPELPPVVGNAHKLEQAMVSLLKNACDAVREQRGAITLATCHDVKHQRVLVRVTDTGVGISADIRPFIIDPFFTTKRESGGTGLGLTTSSRIFEMHRADMKIDSEPGCGTTVTVRFPVAET